MIQSLGLLLALCATSPPRAASVAGVESGSQSTPAAQATDAGEESASPIAAALAAADAAVETLLAVPASERTVANTLLALDDAFASLYEAARYPGFMADVAVTAEGRARGRRAAQDLAGWQDRLERSEDVARALVELMDRGPDLDPEEARLLERLLGRRRRAGFGLGSEERARLTELDASIVELEGQFRRNIAEDETVVLVTEDELRGVPERFLAGLERSGGLCILRLDGATFSNVLGACEVEATRMKVGIAAGFRGGQRNVRVLEELLLLRHERAALLGYPSTAAHVTEPRMAGSPAAVRAFYDDLIPRLHAKAAQELAEYEAAKREHTGDPDARMTASDVSFFTGWLKRERYAVDTSTLREYFAYDAVTEGLFGVFEELFELDIEDITREARAAGRPFWSDDVRLYRVADAGDGGLRGEFYLDPFPRDGKFRGAAEFTLRLRKRWKDGRLSTPIVALVTNFAPPTEDTPALLTHPEVVTYFHEFGHCLHTLLSDHALAHHATASLAQDFWEAPSQLLENWAWSPEVLARFARHFETGEPLDPSVLEAMARARNVGAALSAQGQVFNGLMDLRFHSDGDGAVDTTAVSEQCYREARIFEPAPHLVRQAAFWHLAGYESAYYGYLWSKVYAQDMWSAFAADPMNAEVAARYRACVLSKGGAGDELEMVRSFLGREPNAAAFLGSLGLE